MCSRGIVSVLDIERAAADILPRAVRGYYYSGADAERTKQKNLDAFGQIKLRPRVLRDVSELNTETTLLGEHVRSPIGASPSAMQKMAHPDGEIGNAKACSNSGSCLILSTLSTSSLEEVAEASGEGLHWFQLYVYKDLDVTRSLVQRAERAGYKALVLTVDTPVLGQREIDHHNQFKLPAHLHLGNFKQNTSEGNRINQAHLQTYFGDLIDPSLSWKCIQWLRSITKLPIVLKGVLTKEDAELAIEAGVDAIMVSNHGGRQLDDVSSTIEVLPEVVAAVNGRCEVYMDGGIRRGSDVFKALALGARAVFVGRPILYGLALNGEEGVSRMLKILYDELKRAMALTGCAKLSDINSNFIVARSLSTLSKL